MQSISKCLMKHICITADFIGIFKQYGNIVFIIIFYANKILKQVQIFQSNFHRIKSINEIYTRHCLWRESFFFLIFLDNSNSVQEEFCSNFQSTMPFINNFSFNEMLHKSFADQLGINKTLLKIIKFIIHKIEVNSLKSYPIMIIT